MLRTYLIGLVYVESTLVPSSEGGKYKSLLIDCRLFQFLEFVLEKQLCNRQQPSISRSLSNLENVALFSRCLTAIETRQTTSRTTAQKKKVDFLCSSNFFCRNKVSTQTNDEYHKYGDSAPLIFKGQNMVNEFSL